MPSSPHRTIKIRKVKPRSDGTIDAVEPERDEGWWQSVLNDPKADAPRPQYGLEHLGSMARMLLGVRCEKCQRSKNFYADDLIKMYGAGISARTVAGELLDCNRRSQGCLVRYVGLPIARRKK
jgi:hypothetical protein